MLADAEPLVVVSVATHGGYSFADVLPGSSRRPSDALFRSKQVPGTCLAPRGLFRTHWMAGRSRPSSTRRGRRGSQGVLVKHVREVEGCRFLAETLGLGADDRCGLIVPISHAFGLTCMHASIAAGAEGVLVESSFSPAPLLRALRGARGNGAARFADALSHPPEGAA